MVKLRKTSFYNLAKVPCIEKKQAFARLCKLLVEGDTNDNDKRPCKGAWRLL